MPEGADPRRSRPGDRRKAAMGAASKRGPLP